MGCTRGVGGRGGSGGSRMRRSSEPAASCRGAHARKSGAWREGRVQARKAGPGGVDAGQPGLRRSVAARGPGSWVSCSLTAEVSRRAVTKMDVKC